MKGIARITVFLACTAPIFGQNSNLYFPPKLGNTWETTAPASLGFCPERVDSLYQFLGDRHTKGFLLLKDGRIVLEKYFGTFTQDSAWFWASAGKTATAFMVGQAQENGLVDIEKPTSYYLDTAWTSCEDSAELAITLRHQLTMTTGLDDALMPIPGIPDMANCTQPECLVCLAEPGTRWAYHNAPYRLIHDVLESASGLTINQLTRNLLFNRTGMKGLWYDHILYSTPRNMARFGLLLLAKGIWSGDTLLHDQAYFSAMTHPSQSLNKSYGYLTWLNGQPSFMLPQSQLVFPFKLVTNAPNDMFAALGKYDQKIHVVPSKGWVVVRMGEAGGPIGPNGNEVPIFFDNDLWGYLNALVCNPTGAAEAVENQVLVSVSPNPAAAGWNLKSQSPMQKIEAFDAAGRPVARVSAAGQTEFFLENSAWKAGVYFLKIETERGVQVLRAMR